MFRTNQLQKKTMGTPIAVTARNLTKGVKGSARKTFSQFSPEGVDDAEQQEGLEVPEVPRVSG
jgi:hypothetical protein